MINFRYHVVSLAAVFLALAIGLVVGTAAANGPLAENLNDQITKITSEKQQLRDDLEQARTELEKNEDYARETAPMLLAGKLAGKHVALFVLEGSDKDVDKAANGVADTLRAAGATVTCRIKLRENFTAPSSKDALADLAESTAPSSVKGALPSLGNAVDTSTALLAAVLIGKAGAAPIEGSRTVLSAYESMGYIGVDGDCKSPAEAVILVAGAASAGKDTKERNAAALTIATRLEVAGHLVVAGLSASGLVQAVRNDASIAKSVSTVDNVVTAQGQVAAVLALVQLLGGKAGHYGISDPPDGLLPRSTGARDGS